MKASSGSILSPSAQAIRQIDNAAFGVFSAAHGLGLMAHAAKALLIALMSALVCATSSIADTATDVELYAAYCMGVHAVEKEYFSQKEVVEIERGAGFEPVWEVMEQKRARHHAYLTARGFGINRGPVATRGVSLASQRGRTDKDCLRCCR